ncbi:MAG: extracellular solute-binding protein [Alphaproteobacteria bacterium]
MTFLNTSKTFGRAVATATCGLALAASMALSTAAHADGEVNVYSLRQQFLLEPIFEAFTAETGIEVNVLYSGDEMIERMAQEGENSPADVVMTSSFGTTLRVAEEGLAQAVHSDTLDARIPEQFRDENDQWYALTMRARIIYASRDRVAEGAITDYAQLADPEWEGRICTRSGTHPYNVQLFASRVARYGEEATREWLQGLKNNLARQPDGNDRAQVRAVMEGECDLAVGNSYYYFKMLAEEEQRPWAESVNPVLATAGEHGTHVNVSGVLMAAHAPNPENAIILMEFLAGEQAQRIYADANYEYPVNPSVAPSEALQGLGELTPDSLPLNDVYDNIPTALRLVAEVGYNE